MCLADNGGKWEVKLQLYSGGDDRRYPIPVLEVYGATDQVCEELDLDNFFRSSSGKPGLQVGVNT